MRLLADLRGHSLSRGDVVRLAHNYDLGPDSGPVDLMVYDPAPEAGLGLIVISGYKAGLNFCIFPRESVGEVSRCLDISWMIANWDRWFCFTYHSGDGDRPLPVP